MPTCCLRVFAALFSTRPLRRTSKTAVTTTAKTKRAISPYVLSPVFALCWRRGREELAFHLQCCVSCVCVCVCCKSFPHLCSVCVAPTLCPPPFIPRRISRPPLVSSERGRYFSPGSKRSPRSEPLLLFCISACGVCVCVWFFLLSFACL